jgi:hypothetical protein
MRTLRVLGLCVLVSGCAFTKQVQQFGVEYNTALAGMNNEQALLNILRAKDGMPTHFTSVSQFRGTLNLTASANVNGQLKADSLTRAITSGFTNTAATTASTTTTVPSGGGAPSVATVDSTVTTPVASGSNVGTTVSGGDIYTPQVSGQVVSGTAFDVNVFDTQKFFQGITSEIPFSTIDSLLVQGFDNRMIAALTIARVDFLARDEGHGFAKGARILQIVNDPSDPVQAARFAQFLNCYHLGSATVAGSATNVVAISRITRGPDGKIVPLPLDKMILLDGDKWTVSDPGIGSEPENDEKVFLTRLSPAKRIARLTPRGAQQCAAPGYAVRRVRLSSGQELDVAVPKDPNNAQEPIYLGSEVALRLVDKHVEEIPVTMEITFRSPEGLFRYLGSYLANNAALTLPVGGGPLFSVTAGRRADALAQVRYRGQVYSLLNDARTGTRNAQVLTLLQQLIDLHKEASDRPTVIPVRAIQ